MADIIGDGIILAFVLLCMFGMYVAGHQDGHREGYADAVRNAR